MMGKWFEGRSHDWSIRTGENRTGENRTGEIRTGRIGTDRNRAGKIMAGENLICEGRFLCHLMNLTGRWRESWGDMRSAIFRLRSSSANSSVI